MKRLASRTIVTLLEHKDFLQQHYHSQFLSSAGYLMPESPETVFDDVDLFEAIPWNRGIF